MFLSSHAIQLEVAENELLIFPFDVRCLKPASYVLSLGFRFRRWHSLEQPIRPWSACAAQDHLAEPVEADSCLLLPRQFVLGCTVEKIAFPMKLFGVISPLSHIARFGLTITGGADFVNPGFGSTSPTELTLELSNANESPIELTPGMPIAHLRIGRVEGDTMLAPQSTSIYEGADPIGEPKLFEEWSPLKSPEL